VALSQFHLCFEFYLDEKDPLFKVVFNATTSSAQKSLAFAAVLPYI
jgi:hypothetical protein